VIPRPPVDHQDLRIEAGHADRVGGADRLGQGLVVRVVRVRLVELLAHGVVATRWNVL
jgi:hypothetical protein